MLQSCRGVSDPCRINADHRVRSAVACGNGPASRVEVAGFEPASFGASVGLLRAQPARACRGRHYCRRRCRPVANEDVPSVQLA